MDNWAISFNASAPGFDVSAAFWEAEGDVSFDTNQGAPAQEIGRYYGPVDSQRLARFVQMLRRDVFTLPQYTGRISPGTPRVSFRESRVGSFDAIAVASFPADKLPPAMRPAIDEATALCDEVRRYPGYVLRGEAKWTSPTFTPQGPVSMAVTLKNVGTKAISIQNPFHKDEDGESVFQLLMQRLPDAEKGVPPKPKPVSEDEEEEEVTYLDLPAQCITKKGGGKAPASGRVTLQPGGKIELIIRKRVSLAPGRYQAAAVYRGEAEDDKKANRIGGRLTMDAGPFTVAGAQSAR